MFEFEMFIVVLLAAFGAGYAVRGWVGKELKKLDDAAEKAAQRLEGAVAKYEAAIKAKL